jgi:hypothetical protein
MEIDQQQRKIKVIDSYLFITMRLSKIPEAMGIPDLTKGYHPYYFTDLNYIGPMVGLEYFDLSAVESREKFDQWCRTTKKNLRISRSYLLLLST